MFLTAIGLLVGLLPLAPVARAADRTRAFLAAAALAASWHLAVALATQATGTFSYPAVLGAHLLYGAGAVAYALRRRGGDAAPASPPRARRDWFPVAALALVAAFLLSVHFAYSGPVDTAVGPRESVRESYPYPLFSDEWVAVALANQTIETGRLPLTSPLDGSRFPNLLVGFHAIVAEALVLLALEPLTGYVGLAVANGVGIAALAFVALRRFGVGSAPAAVAALVVPFIANGGNLAGVWYLIPLTLSLGFLLLAIAGHAARSPVALWLGLTLSVAVYPGSLLFAAPVALAAVVGERGWRSRLRAARWGAIAFVAALAAVLAAASQLGLGEILRFAAGLTVRDFVDPGRVRFAPWNVVPIFALPLAAIGLWEIWRRRVLAVALPLAVALAWWLLYLFVDSVVLIEPARAVTVAAVLLAIAAGFGVDRVVAEARRRFGGALGGVAPAWARGLTLAFFAALAAFPASFATWHRNVLVVERPGGGRVELVPSPPVTRYLAADDLRLFAGARGERFIAPPWKGLAIAAATGALPLESKPSTLWVRRFRFADFYAASCDGKTGMAARYRIDLAYAPPFACAGFEEVGRGVEGLALYRVAGRAGGE